MDQYLLLPSYIYQGEVHAQVGGVRPEAQYIRAQASGQK